MAIRWQTLCESRVRPRQSGVHRGLALLHCSSVAGKGRHSPGFRAHHRRQPCRPASRLGQAISWAGCAWRGSKGREGWMDDRHCAKNKETRDPFARGGTEGGVKPSKLGYAYDTSSHYTEVQSRGSSLQPPASSLHRGGRSTRAAGTAAPSAGTTTAECHL